MTRDADLIRRALHDAATWFTLYQPELPIRKTLEEAERALDAAPVQEPPSPGVTAGATGMVADDSLNARLHEVGNQIHNIACEHQSNEDMVERLGDLRAEIWAVAAMLPATPPPVVARVVVEQLIDLLHCCDVEAQTIANRISGKLGQPCLLPDGVQVLEDAETIIRAAAALLPAGEGVE